MKHCEMITAADDMVITQGEFKKIIISLKNFYFNLRSAEVVGRIDCGDITCCSIVMVQIVTIYFRNGHWPGSKCTGNSNSYTGFKMGFIAK